MTPVAGCAAGDRVAALPMYDLPGLEAANNALWLAVASRLTANGIHNVPSNLSRTIPSTELWHHPRLLLAQSCGYPLVTSLRDAVEVVATPQYHAPGGPALRWRGNISIAVTDRSSTTPVKGPCSTRAITTGIGHCNASLLVFARRRDAIPYVHPGYQTPSRSQ